MVVKPAWQGDSDLVRPSRLAFDRLRLAPQDEDRFGTSIFLRPRDASFASALFRNQVSATRKSRKRLIRQSDERFLFSSRPSLDLTFTGNRVRDPVVRFSKDENSRPAPGRIAVDGQVVVFPNSRLYGLFRRTDIVTAVSTSKDVNGHLELHTPSPLTSHPNRTVDDTTAVRSPRLALGGCALPHPEVRAKRASKDARS